MPKIKVDIHPDNFLDCYQHTIDSDYDIEFLYGSRDSGKSRHIAQVFVTLAMAFPKLRCVLIRKVFNTIKDSQWQMIKQVAEEWGVDHLFKFKTSPLEISCASGAQFLCRGLDDPKKLKSVTNPTHAWVEEGDGIEENDWTLITTSLRSNDYNTQIWFSFNPDVPGVYTDHWLYKRYFSHTEDLSFSYISTEELFLDDGTTDTVSLRIRATHSTWMDNPYCKASRKAYYLGLKRTSEYDHRVYCLGLWGTRKVGDEFFKRFQANIHVKRVAFNPRIPVYCSIDNNVLPYCALTFWQVSKEEDGIYYLRQIAEAPARPPDNSAYGLAKNVIAFLRTINYRHTGQFVGICGDRSTKNQSTIDEKKRSFFQIVVEQVRKGGYRVEDKFLSFAPSPSAIADFANAIFNDELPHIQIEIGAGCSESIKDYGITKTDKDGNIYKTRTADYDGGPSYEHNGHLTDTAKDFIVQAMYPEFEKFCNRHMELEPGGISTVNRTSKLTP